MEALKIQGKKRSIGQLVDMATPVITNTDLGYPLMHFCDLSMSPNTVRNRVFERLERTSIPIIDREKLAKSARWLAIIYRDYGSAVFQQVIDLVRTINASQLKDIRHEKDCGS